jgi:predicted RNA polymerase sigma factor
LAEVLDIEALYERYGPMVLRRCRGLLRDEEKAVEAMQDVFVQVLRRQGTLKMEHPSSLLYQIATNVSLNLIRSKKRRPEDATEDDVLTRIAYAPENDGRSVARLTLDRIFVQVGGGALATGIGDALRDEGVAPPARIHAVQTAGCAPLARAWRWLHKAG